MATNLEFIKSASGSSVSALDLIDCFSADYDVYYLSISKLDQNSVSNEVKINFLDSGGSQITSANYDQATLVMKSNTTFTESRSTNITFDFIGYGVRDSEDGIGLGMYIFNPYDSSSYTFYTVQNSYIVLSGANLEGYKKIGVLKLAQQLSGIRFACGNSGTYDNITVNIFGVK